MNLNTPEVAEAAVETPVDEEAAFANTAEEVAANPDFVAADTASNEGNGDAKTEAVDEDAPEEDAEAAPERRLPKLGRYVDSGNDLIEAQMPDMVQASDEDEMRRAIRQHRVLYAKVVAIEPMGDGIKIVAKRNTMRVVFVPEDFFKYSLMKDMDGLSNEEKTIRYKRKANRMLGAVISFIPRDVGYFTDDFGTRIPFAVGSRADALAQLQNRYFFRANPQTRVEVGSTTTASVLSCGPRYVIVEAFGVEVSMGTGALSAFEYIEDASKSFKVGMGIPVAVEALEVDTRAKTVNIRVSHSLLERMSAKVEGVSESMIGGRYLATIVNVTDKYYHVVLDGLKIRGVIPKTQNISNEMLMIGDKVSMLVRYINKEQALVIGGCHKI